MEESVREHGAEPQQKIVQNAEGQASEGAQTGGELVTLEDLAAYASRTLQMPDYDVRAYSPLTLAFLGDAVYELVIRTMVVTKANTNPNQLNKQSSGLVKAATQAQMMHIIMEHLTDQEMAVYKRGRNAHSATKAKNATVTDYRTATGFEALMGYLYLQGKLTRIIDLVHIGLDGRK